MDIRDEQGEISRSDLQIRKAGAKMPGDDEDPGAEPSARKMDTTEPYLSDEGQKAK